MIKAYDNVGRRDEVSCDLTGGALPDGVVWIDLLDPQPDELRYVEQFLPVPLPDDEDLGELQTATRLRSDGETVQVFTPVVFRDSETILRTTTVGFILGVHLLVTIRTEELFAFRDYIQRETKEEQRIHAPADVFVGLLETIVDRIADGMQKVGAELDEVSRAIFSPKLDRVPTQKPVRYEAHLEKTLRTIGRSGDLTSTIRDSLLGLGRLLAFVSANAADNMPAGAKARAETLRQDIASLNDYETRLTDKVQFLLDSTLGFISIDQNRLFKLLTIASVLGIPPTFVVGLYGMNFKNMPEYDWSWGYQWGLLIVALSIIVPAVWLRWKGWV